MKGGLLPTSTSSYCESVLTRQAKEISLAGIAVSIAMGYELDGRGSFSG
jgi:hypothetical protein